MTAAAHRPWTLYFLFCAFGISSWITINAAFAELPIFAQQHPEGWAIGTYMGAAMQLANVFIVLERFLAKKCHLPTHYLVYVLLGFGTVTTVLLALFWDWTPTVFGSVRSAGLLLFVFLGGGVDCTTSVVYWPFVAQYAPLYTSALGAGEAMSASVIGVLSLFQSPSDPRFSVSSFFLIVAILMVGAAGAFTIIHQHFPPNRFAMKESHVALVIDDPTDKDTLLAPSADKEVYARAARALWWPLLVIFFANAVQNGVLISLTTYAFLPLVDGSRWMSIAIAVQYITQPAAHALVAIFQFNKLGLLTLPSVLLTAFVVQAASMQTDGLVPNAPFMMFVTVLLQILLSFTKTNVFWLMKQKTPEDLHCAAYRLGGIATQMGSGIAAFLMIILVDVAKVFSNPS
eukprot:TRINITY_DN5406_c0_g1_i1.p1 TRINITY_DN5406_c0_g1~~TRINITY_DN5406_c0_g1_i1.p1  ORF type:complete len:401 (+),score=65.79 TRINITY_DN5406_c0_g1_i1:25-1227(+)